MTTNTDTLRELVTRLAIEIDPKAVLDNWPEALAFQCDMARAVIAEVEKKNIETMDAQRKLLEKALDALQKACDEDREFYVDFAPSISAITEHLKAHP